MAVKQTMQQLKAQNELKIKWLALLAHDFKGSFSNILWLMDAYEQKAINEATFFKLLPEVKQQVEMHQRSIQDTFEWIKRQMETFSPELSEIDLSGMLDALETIFDEALQKKNLRIVRNRETERPVLSDVVMLRFILKRLIENAIKYSNINGQIHIQCEGQGSLFAISIKDTGKGMESEALANLFTLDGAPYTGTLNEKGNGLSLIIVKDFVEMLGGRINIRSATDKGTEIEITWLYGRKDTFGG